MSAFSEMLPGCLLIATIESSCKSISSRSSNLRIAKDLEDFDKTFEEFLTFEEYVQAYDYHP